MIQLEHKNVFMAFELVEATAKHFDAFVVHLADYGYPKKKASQRQASSIYQSWTVRGQPEDCVRSGSPVKIHGKIELWIRLEQSADDPGLIIEEAQCLSRKQ